MPKRMIPSNLLVRKIVNTGGDSGSATTLDYVIGVGNGTGFSNENHYGYGDDQANSVFYGSISPDASILTNNAIRRLTVLNDGTVNLEILLDNFDPLSQDVFLSITLEGIGTLNSADADSFSESGQVGIAGRQFASWTWNPSTTGVSSNTQAGWTVGTNKNVSFEIPEVTESFVCCPEWVDLGADQYYAYDLTVNNTVEANKRYFDLFETDPSWGFTTTTISGVGDVYIYDGNSYPSGPRLRRSSTDINGTFHSPDGGVIADELCVYIEFIGNNVFGDTFDLEFIIKALNQQSTVLGSTDTSLTQTEYQNNLGNIIKVSIPIDTSFGNGIYQIEFESFTYPTVIIHDIRACNNGSLSDYPFAQPT